MNTEVINDWVLWSILAIAALGPLALYICGRIDGKAKWKSKPQGDHRLFGGAFVAYRGDEINVASCTHVGGTKESVTGWAYEAAKKKYPASSGYYHYVYIEELEPDLVRRIKSECRG